MRWKVSNEETRLTSVTGSPSSCVVFDIKGEGIRFRVIDKFVQYPPPNDGVFDQVERVVEVCKSYNEMDSPNWTPPSEKDLSSIVTDIIDAYIRGCAR